MAAYWILYFYVVITTLLCSVNKENLLYSMRHILLALLVIVLVIFSGFRGVQVDADSANYLGWFQGLNEIDGNDLFLFKDPAFYIVGSIISGLGLGISYLFLSYASVALWSKFQLIKYFAYAEYSHYFLYLYFCRFYFVHDMTQIRIGAATGLATLALILLFRKNIYLSIAAFILAIAFHLSVILMLPFFVLLSFGYCFESRLPLFLILCLAGMVNVNFDLFINILGLNDFTRIADYVNGDYDVKPISLFSFYFIVKASLLSFLILFRWRSLRDFDRMVVYLVMAGLLLQVALMNNDALALRAAEVFAVFDLILFITPFLFLSASFKAGYAVFIFLVGSIFFVSSLKIMGPYTLASIN